MGANDAVHTFRLKGEEATLDLEGEPPEVSAPYAGWNYVAELRGHSLQVRRNVGDDNPASFVEFFVSMARDWRGWAETRAYESLDGTLSITATHDRVGSVRLEVRLRGDAGTGFDWSATHRLSLEEGRLLEVAAAAKAFAR
jgi:hypothetical protein